ncbi:MAG: hypothetical protein Q4A28_08705 [Brachymonas sp.]|nr:hypothetical protein [Brachymonas sp.]
MRQKTLAAVGNTPSSVRETSQAPHCATFALHGYMTLAAAMKKALLLQTALLLRTCSKFPTGACKWKQTVCFVNNLVSHLAHVARAMHCVTYKDVRLAAHPVPSPIASR